MGFEMLKDALATVETISRKTGKSESEVQKLVDAKKEKFSGLLTDAGAAFMIAKELGVELGAEISENTKISGLKEGMNNIDVICRLKKAFPQKSFDKNGKKGVLQNIVLSDGSGEINATLWHKDVQKFSELNAKTGDCLKLGNCSISSFNGRLQLNLNYNSTFLLEENAQIPALEEKTVELKSLGEGMNDVNLSAAIKKIFPVKNFESERGKGKLVNFMIWQGTEECRATAWNSAVDEILKFSEGDEIKVSGAYTKKGMNGIELHLGNYAKIEKV